MHERGPEDGGQVGGGHLVDLLVLLDQVQVVHEVAQRAQVGAGHLPEDAAQLPLLVHLSEPLRWFCEGGGVGRGGRRGGENGNGRGEGEGEVVRSGDMR